MAECVGDAAGRPPHDPAARRRGGFKTKIDQYCDLVTVNVFYKNSRLKNLKDGIALRIETVVNNPRDLGCNRLLPNLPERQARACVINTRLIETETVGRARHL